MRVLITSGGTKIAIDQVRNITNMSKGTFGSHIAEEALKADMTVTYLVSEGGKTPMSMNIDLNKPKNWTMRAEALHELFNFHSKYQDKYNEIKYSTFQDYAEKLNFLCCSAQPDVVILAAAVSDYDVVDFTDGKIRSGKDLTIKLKEVPKLINNIKDWCPNTYLVGFKLLVGSTDVLLCEAAHASIQKNRCNLVVANDLNTLRNGHHEITLYSTNKAHHKIIEGNLAKAVIDRVLEDLEEK